MITIEIFIKWYLLQVRVNQLLVWISLDPSHWSVGVHTLEPIQGCVKIYAAHLGPISVQWGV